MSEHNRPPKHYVSPVDYEAWRKGYLPPSEHILIHELSVSDARVLASMSSPNWSCMSSPNWSWWLVVKGDMDQDDFEEVSALISRALQRKYKNDQKRKEEAEQEASTDAPAEADTPAQPEGK